MKRKRLQILILFLVSFILHTLCQCVAQNSRPIYVKDGKIYGRVAGTFRHRWWNYYERGLSYADGEFYREAQSDLREALRQRDKDQRMARTYGMHFIDYFPHRELGIVLYQLGDLQEAKKEFELSLSQFPSAKARFYLDRVRKALIEQKAPKITPPRVTLDFKTQEVWTREDPVVISGLAEDEQYVAAIKIRGVPLFLEGSKKRIPFSEPLVLAQGPHTIEVEAKNLLGKATKRQVVIHVDRQGPLVTIDELRLDEKAAEKKIVISGFIYDEAGVSGVLINNMEIPIRQGVEVPFSKRLTVDTSVLELVARDRLGNQTSATIPLSGASKEISTLREKDTDTIAPLKSEIRNPQSAIRNPQSAIRNPMLLACADSDVCNGLIAAMFGPSDIRPPILQLRGWTDTQTVYVEKIYLEGQVSDESKIESLTINQIPILLRKGQNIFFSYLAELQEGENSIIVEARDEAGNLAREKISVFRRVPKALQLAERLSISVIPFEQKGAVSEASVAFQDNLIAALVDRDRFRVIERDKLDLILQEQKLSRSDLIDRSTALRLGRLVAAQSIIPGSIIETRAGIEIVARMIDTETSEIMATEDVYDEAKDLPALRSLAEGMAIKFHREFPLLGGLVIQSKGEQIFTDLGKGKIKLQRRLIVYREEPIEHPVTGKVLGADNEILGRARVTQVLPEMSRAELLDDKGETIKRLDKVITE
jgi:TolB-like protein